MEIRDEAERYIFAWTKQRRSLIRRAWGRKFVFGMVQRASCDILAILISDFGLSFGG